MKFLNQKVIFIGLFLFVIIHVILGENGSLMRQNQDIFPLGLNPSITHDSYSTRNQVIEDPFGILVDLPGGYSFYLSPILVTIPLLSDNLINGFPLPQLSGIENPNNQFLTQLEFQRLFFLGVSGILCVFSVLIFFGLKLKKQRKDYR
jgi:hypothetical protein